MSPEGRAALRRINRDIDRRSIAALGKLGMSREEASAYLGIPEPVTLTDVWEQLRRDFYEPLAEAWRTVAATLKEAI